MASKQNLKENEDLQKDPSTPCLAAGRNVRFFSIAWGNVRVFPIAWLQLFRRNDGEGVNVADEAFPQDQYIENKFKLDCVLPGHDSEDTSGRPQSKEEKTFSDSLDLMELEDFPTSEFSTQWKSPPCSPLRLDSLASTPGSEAVNFELKQENDPRESPPCSSMRLDSLPSTPDSQNGKYVLKQEVILAPLGRRNSIVKSLSSKFES